MKRTVRQGVFESNSSAMHSITIMKNNEYYTAEEIEKDTYLYKGEWDIWDEDSLNFTRSPFECLATFESKWRYCLAALCKKYNDDTYKELERIAYTYIAGLKVIKIPNEEKFVPILGAEDSDYNRKYGKTEEEMNEYLEDLKKKMEIDEIVFWEGRDNTYWYYEIPYTGYAEDYGMLRRFLDERKISLEEFITNKKYVIIVDGDERCIWDSVKNAGLVNNDAIEEEYRKVEY